MKLKLGFSPPASFKRVLSTVSSPRKARFSFITVHIRSCPKQHGILGRTVYAYVSIVTYAETYETLVFDINEQFSSLFRLVIVANDLFL
jgi:hypothetical protein